jgi:SAM-dependent methyltransferase
MITKGLGDLTLDDLERYLAGWQVEAHTAETIKKELSDSLEKIRLLLEYLPSDSGRILQVGSSPFFLSSLLNRYGNNQLSLVDFVDWAGQNPQNELTAKITDSLEEGEYAFSYRAFDIEDTIFPFSDGVFDGAILFDVLQRLTRNPVFVLAEISRVLKHGGWLLFCSPNAAYYGNMVKVWLSQNPFALYSTQSIIDRDNRPFTIPEISDLFADLHGLEIVRMDSRSIGNESSADWRIRGARVLTHLLKRGRLNEEYIFCLARKQGELRPSRPQWLYKTYAPYYPPVTKPLERSRLRLQETPSGPPHLSRRICKLCDVHDWYGTEWLGYLDQMGEPYESGIYHRKSWEWAQGLYALDQLGFLREDATALGVGAGTEQIMFYLANRVKMVTATDIYGRGSFANLTAHGDMLTSPEKYAKIPYRKNHLTVEHMDGTNLEYADEFFDFVFSFSSIEHFGSKAAASQAVREMGRVVKPGGIVIITTEVILNGAPHQNHYRPSELIDYLVDDIGLSLLEDIDFSLSDETLARPVDFRHPGFGHVKPHVICQLGEVYWTSVCLALVKPPQS